MSATRYITISSKNSNHYNRINNIYIPTISHTQYVRISVVKLCTMCQFRTLRKDDYITFAIDDKNVSVTFDDFGTLAPSDVCEVFNKYITEKEIPIECSTDQCHRIRFTSEKPFEIINASYNAKLISGLYSYSDEQFPMKSQIVEKAEPTESNVIQLNAVGFGTSTPVLYLVSNMGVPINRASMDDFVNIQSAQVCLDIANSFTESTPIQAYNNGYSRILPACQLSSAYFILVDANMHEIDLLCPMYLTISVEPVSSQWDSE